MITDFCAYGDLYKWLHKTENVVDWKMRLKLATDIAKGMKFLHDATPPLVHRDLKTPNILMYACTSDAPVVCKVSDFGLSRRLSPTMTLTKRSVDTPFWLAPEVMAGLPYSESCDVYAFGIMLWELLTRKVRNS
jgi:serine/threonine protein kinase